MVNVDLMLGQRRRHYWIDVCQLSMTQHKINIDHVV